MRPSRFKRKVVRNVLVLFDVPPDLVGIRLSPWDRAIVAIRRRWHRKLSSP